MKNNTLLLIAGAALIYFLMKKKGASATTALMPSTTASLIANQIPQYEEKPGIFEQMLPSSEIPFEAIKSQTVNFPQIAPTPSSIIDLPSSQGADYPGCNCCNKSRLLGMPVVC